MYSEDLALFKKALIEAAVSKYEEALEQCEEEVTFSKRHKKIMERIIYGSGKVTPVKRKKMSKTKRLIAILAAAAILLFGGITVYAKRDAIVHFVEQIFEKFTKTSYQDDSVDGTATPDTIEKEYMPAYVPEGYELQEHVSDLIAVRIKWQNSDGEFITFEQSVIESIYDYDNEHRNFETQMVGEYSVYMTHSNNLNTYMWSDGKYSYSISCTDNISVEEISQMILSVAK